MVRGSNIYLVCGYTMCGSTCQVEFILQRTVFLLCSGDFSVLKRTVLHFNSVMHFNYYYPGGRYRKMAGLPL